jgi:integrase
MKSSEKMPSESKQEINEVPDRNMSRQEPEPKLRKRKGRPGIWEARYRRYAADGTVERPREVFGDEREFPTKTALKNSPKWKQFIECINDVRVVVLFRDLCHLYHVEEIPKRVVKGRSTAKGQLCYLEEKWGGFRLDQLIRMKYDIRNWLEGDLRLRSNPEVDASRQTRKHLRTLFVQMLTYAVDKHYLPYNPFTGTTLTVRKGGEPPVDRSEFFVTPGQFLWMLNDPLTPGHVKMMILIAYTTGLRSEEFLALKWSAIEFDGPEPKIRIERTVDGKHIREAAKTDNSKKSGPMCDRLGAALLYYKDENPAVNDWVFGSLRTGRPLHRTALGADHLLPALQRMAAAFKREIPNGIPKGTGFHAFRHAYNALIAQVGTDDPKKVKEVQMKLLRHGDERTNDRYGKSAPPLRQRARQAHINVSDLAMGEAVS